jgi:hypothetical protein
LTAADLMTKPPDIGPDELVTRAARLMYNFRVKRPSKPRSTIIPVTTPSPTLRTGCSRIPAECLSAVAHSQTPDFGLRKPHPVCVK